MPSSSDRAEDTKRPAGSPAESHLLLDFFLINWLGQEDGPKDRGKQADPLWEQGPDEVEEASIHLVEVQLFLQVQLDPLVPGLATELGSRCWLCLSCLWGCQAGFTLTK